MKGIVCIILILSAFLNLNAQITLDSDSAALPIRESAHSPLFPVSELKPDTTVLTGSAKGTYIQEVDTTPLETDSVKPHSARKAALFSAVLPGLGQVYNHKYWKVPIVYGAFAGLGYLVYYNGVRYQAAHKALKNYYDDDSGTIARAVIHYNKKDSVVYTSLNDLQTIRNYYRNFLDLSAIGIGVVYALNIIDAVVDAHLYDFDVSNNLSMRIKPNLNGRYAFHNLQCQPTLSFQLNFHRSDNPNFKIHSHEYPGISHW